MSEKFNPNDKKVLEEIDAFLKGRDPSASSAFRGTCEKDPIGYACGEEMVFRIYPVSAREKIGVPLVKWICDGDDGKHTEGEVTCDAGEDIFIRTSCDVPGFVRVRAIACDSEGNPLPDFQIYEGGAGAEVAKIQRDTEIPEDFDAFWEELGKDLDACPPVILESTPIEGADYEDYYVTDIRIACPYGAPVSGILTIPKGKENLPAMVSYMGYGVNSALPRCLSDRIVLAINAHGVPNGKSTEFYRQLSKEMFKGTLYAFDPTENENKDTCYFKGMMARALQAARYVKSLPQWNKKDLLSYGGSQGALQSITVAAHDKDVSMCFANVPWMANTAGYLAGKMRGWSPDFRDGLRYFDTAVQATRVRCPIYIQAGLGDYVCPPSSIMAIYNGINAPKRLDFHQNHTHPYRAPYLDYTTLGDLSGVKLSPVDYPTVEARVAVHKLATRHFPFPPNECYWYFGFSSADELVAAYEQYAGVDAYTYKAYISEKYYS